MSDMTHEKKNGLLLDLLAYIHTHIHTYVSPSMQTHLCVCVCVCRDTHTLGRGAWEAAEEELEAAPGEKETWEAAAEEAAAAAGEEATASPAGGGSTFVCVRGDMGGWLGGFAKVDNRFGYEKWT